MNRFLHIIQTHPIFAYLLVLFVGYFIFFWDLGAKELFGEEGRRALCAMYYLQTGTYLVPQVFGEPYLNKPPGYPWLIVLSSYLFGGINEWSVRFPSAVLSLVTLFLILTFSRNQLSIHIRLLASLIYCAMFESVMKGRIGETDAALTCFVFASLWCWWHGLHSVRSNYWNVLSGLSLAGALVMKGPPALIFFYGAVIAYCVSIRRYPWLYSIHHAVLASTALFFTSLWLIPFLNQIHWNALSETGSRELLRGDGLTLSGTLINQFLFIGGSFLAYLPASFLALFWMSKQIRHHQNEYQDELVFLLCYTVTGFVFFLLFPETRIRYILPIAPALALFAALIWSRLIAWEENVYLRQIYRIFYYTVTFIALLDCIWGLGRIWQPVSGFIVPFIVLTTGCGLLVWMIRCRGSRLKPDAVFVSILSIIVFMFIINAEKVLQHNPNESLKEMVRNWQSKLGNQTIYIDFEGEFNFFYYLGVPVKRIYHIDEVPISEHTIDLAHNINPSEFDKLNEPDWKMITTQTILFSNGNSLYISTLTKKTSILAPE